MRHKLRRELEWKGHVASPLVGLSCLGIRNAEEVDAGHERLGGTNQITNALFVLRVLFDELLNGSGSNLKVAGLESQSFQKLRSNVLFHNDLLVNSFLARARNDLQTIPENGMNLGLIVEREDEQALREVKVNARKLAIMKLRVLRAICEVNQKIDDFLAAIRTRDLVQLVKLQDRIHAASLDE